MTILSHLPPHPPLRPTPATPQYSQFLTGPLLGPWLWMECPSRTRSLAAPYISSKGRVNTNLRKTPSLGRPSRKMSFLPPIVLHDCCLSTACDVCSVFVSFTRSQAVLKSPPFLCPAHGARNGVSHAVGVQYVLVELEQIHFKSFHKCLPQELEEKKAPLAAPNLGSSLFKKKEIPNLKLLPTEGYGARGDKSGCGGWSETGGFPCPGGNC